MRDRGSVSVFNKYRIAYAMFLPVVGFVLLVCLYPAFHGIRQSMFKMHFLERERFIGFNNYLDFFRQGGLTIIRNSVVYVLGSLLITVPVSMLLALLLNRPMRFRSLFRTILISTWAISPFIAALIWGWYLNPSFGPLPYLARIVGLKTIDFLGDVNLSMPTVIAINAWRSYPFTMVLLLAQLQMIPVELYESAHVDGASPFVCFRRITLPYLYPTLMVAIVMASLQFFNMITLIFVLTGGGPIHATEVLGVKAYNEAFTHWNIGRASAVSSIIFFLNLLFTITYAKLLKSEAIH